MIYSPNKQDDLVRYENADDILEEEGNSIQNNSYIDFDYESEEESNLRNTPNLQNKNNIYNSIQEKSNQNETNNPNYSQYNTNLQHMESNFNFNYESELEKIDIDDKKINQINSNNFNPTTTKLYSKANITFSNITNNIQNSKINSEKEISNTVISLNDTIKLNVPERKQSILEKYKIQSKESSSTLNNNKHIENKLPSNINNSRDVKKFLNVVDNQTAAVSNPTDEIKKIKNIDEDKVK
jgi:hypothetical protein